MSSVGNLLIITEISPQIMKTLDFISWFDKYL